MPWSQPHTYRNPIYIILYHVHVFELLRFPGRGPVYVHHTIFEKWKTLVDAHIDRYSEFTVSYKERLPRISDLPHHPKLSWLNRHLLSPTHWSCDIAHQIIPFPHQAHQLVIQYVWGQFPCGLIWVSLTAFEFTHEVWNGSLAGGWTQHYWWGHARHIPRCQ